MKVQLYLNTMIERVGWKELWVAIHFKVMWFAAAFFCSCNPAADSGSINAKPIDTSINKANAITDLFLDSTRLYLFIHQQQLNKSDSVYMLSFYRQRNFEYAWFSSAGPAEQSFNFINLFRSYRSTVADSSLYLPAFDKAVDIWLNDSGKYELSPAEVQEMELMLTRQFFRYAERAYKGNESINLADVGWFIPRKKMNPIEFLDSVVANEGRNMRAFLPVHPMFEGLRNALEQYTAKANGNSWAVLQPERATFKKGDSSLTVGLLKKRLILLGDLQASDTGNSYTAQTAAGVASFQQRHGHTADSVAGPAFFAAINVPLEDRIRQILINMERARWVPKPGNGPFVVVNIPAFRLYVFDSSRLQFDMAVVVGTPANNTVIFNGEMKYVLLSPYWNVPYSIVKIEMGRTAGYFARRNMEIVGKYADGLPMVRQKPGAANALGRVKFLFPNSYSIYLHDTPSKSLFRHSKRAFSHGCIRVEQPVRLAHWALRFNTDWTPEKIAAGMHGNKEISITLKQPIPVFIGYFTSWVSADGKVQFRDDVYGHDKKMGAQLFDTK